MDKIQRKSSVKVDRLLPLLQLLAPTFALFAFSPAATAALRFAAALAFGFTAGIVSTFSLSGGTFGGVKSM
jgi:hypothetical protein